MVAHHDKIILRSSIWTYQRHLPMLFYAHAKNPKTSAEVRPFASGKLISLSSMRI